jgi:hypothetical protein
MEKGQKRRIGGVWQDPDSGVWRYRFICKGRRYLKCERKTILLAGRYLRATRSDAGKVNAYE